MDVVWSVLQSLDFDATTFTCQFVLFMFLHGSLNFLVYQPIMEIRDRRDSKIVKGLAAAESAAAEARRLKSDYEEKVRGARADGQLALQEATGKAEVDRKARVEKAREEAAKILRDAREEADAALATAEETLESQSDVVAKAIASKLLSSSLDSKDSKTLIASLGGA